MGTFPELDLITVRDEWSKRNLEEVCDVDVTVTACPAFLYDDPDVESIGKTGVNFRPYFDKKDDLQDSALRTYFGYDDLAGATEAYVKNMQSICQQLDDPIFIPFTPKDETFARKFLNIPIMEFEPSVNETLRRVSSVDKMVATRYHSLIFAAICGKPVLPLAYEPKVKYVAERLEIPSYKPHHEVPVEFHQVSNVDDLKAAAQENFNLLFQYLGSN